jgi:hypothetical protein
MSVTRGSGQQAPQRSQGPDKATGCLHSENMVGNEKCELPVCLCSFPQATRRLYCGCSLEVVVDAGAGSA